MCIRTTTTTTEKSGDEEKKPNVRPKTNGITISTIIQNWIRDSFCFNWNSWMVKTLGEPALRGGTLWNTACCECECECEREWRGSIDQKLSQEHRFFLFRISFRDYQLFLNVFSDTAHPTRQHTTKNNSLFCITVHIVVVWRTQYAGICSRWWWSWDEHITKEPSANIEPNAKKSIATDTPNVSLRARKKEGERNTIWKKK